MIESGGKEQWEWDSQAPRQVGREATGKEEGKVEMMVMLQVGERKGNTFPTGKILRGGKFMGIRKINSGQTGGGRRE